MGGTLSSPGTESDVLSSVRELKQNVARQCDADLDFAPRTQELTHLLTVLEGEPARVTLLIGPRESGKSKLLRHLKDIWLAQSEIRQILSPCLLINLRECLRTSKTAAEGLVEAIKDEIEAWQDMATSIVQESDLEIGRFSESFKRIRYSHCLRTQLDLFQSFLKRNRHVRPLIILDEAQVLQSWCSYTGLLDDVRALFQFFLWLSKENGRGHVVIASSAPFFWSWLSTTLDITALKMVPVGHFSEEDAKSFVISHVIPKHKGFLPAGDFNKDVWKSLYHVTGGSPHLLKIVISDAVELGSWTDALASTVSTKAEELRERLIRLSTYWSFPHLEGIVGAIVNHGGIVGFDKVIMHVFSGDEAEARRFVQKLGEESIIHVRLWTSGMKYVDVGEKSGSDILYLMAVDPACFAAMRQLYPAWFARTKKQEEKRTPQTKSDGVGSGENSDGGSRGDFEEGWDFE